MSFDYSADGSIDAHFGVRAATNGKAPRLQLTRADRVAIVRVEWLAQDRIPLGGVTLFDGPGGIGKTTFLTGVIAKLTQGVDFFTGATIEPRNVLIVGVEDRRAIIVQRLKLGGADLTRVYFVDAAHVGDRDVLLVLPDHVGVLEQAIIDHAIGFVYVDALFSHINLEGEGRMSQEVRAAMQPIGEMCERQNVAFAAMRHWTKTKGSAADRALGSVEFTNFARSVFTFGQHPNDDALVVCSHTKSNYAKLTGAVAFSIVSCDVADDNGAPWQVSIASNVGIVEGVSSDDLSMRLPCDPEERTSAAEWLRDFLADGETHFTADVVDAGAKARAGDRKILWRAARSLGVVMARTNFPAVGTWTLPKGSEQNETTASEQNRLGSPDSGDSRDSDYVYDSAGTTGTTQAKESLVPQGLGSGDTVRTPNPLDPSVPTATPGSDNPAPSKRTDRLPPAVDGRFEL